MVTQQGGFTLPSSATVVANINDEDYVLVYGRDGRSMAVPRSEVPSRLAEGYSFEPTDPDALYQELPALFEGAQEAVEAFWKGVKDDGVVNGSDTAQHGVVVEALDQLTFSVGRFLEGVLLRYPQAQGEAEEAEVDGKVYQFDPSQVLLRSPSGRVEAHARDEAADRVADGYEEIARGSNADHRDEGDGTLRARRGDDLGVGANDQAGIPPELAEYNQALVAATPAGEPGPDAPQPLRSLVSHLQDDGGAGNGKPDRRARKSR